MSYSLTAEVVDRQELKAAVTAAVQSDDSPSPEKTEHLAAVQAAVTGLANAVGRPEDGIRVSVSGHANPGHAPAEGYGDETITVSISVIPAAELVEEDQQ